eukprot:6197149-Pleurochrysis_carterae.AAC.3
MAQTFRTVFGVSAATATTARLQTRRLSLAASCSRRAARATTRTWAPASNPRPPTCAPSPRRSSTRR